MSKAVSLEPPAATGAASDKPSKPRKKFGAYERFSPARLTMLRGLAKRSHRYRLYRFGTIAMTLAVLFAVPIFGVARFDLYLGDHRALGSKVAPLYGFVAVSASIFAAYFLTFQVNLFAGRMFCGWGCPVGQLNRLTDTVAATKDPKARLFWGGVLGVYVLTLSLSVALWWTSASAFWSWPAAIVALLLVIGMAGAAIAFGRIFGWSFCRKACPIGLYYSVVQQKRPLGILYDDSACLDEGGCVKACPVLLDPRDMHEARTGIGGFAIEGLAANSHCLRCGACVEACELVTIKSGRSALVFGRPKEEVLVATPEPVPGTPAAPVIPAMTDAATLVEEKLPEPEGPPVPWKKRLLQTGAIAIPLVAVLVYIVIGQTGGGLYRPKQTWEDPSASRPAPYVVAPGAFSAGTLSGRVTENGTPVAGALVWLDVLGAGLPATAQTDIAIAFGVEGKETYEKPIYLAQPGARLQLENDGHQPHSYSLQQGGVVLRNLSLPPGRTEKNAGLPPPGAYDLGCAPHPNEHARLVVLEHPYAAWTDADGRYRLEKVPAGDVVVSVVTPSQAAARAKVKVAADAEAKSDLAAVSAPPSAR